MQTLWWTQGAEVGAGVGGGGYLGSLYQEPNTNTLADSEG